MAPLDRCRGRRRNATLVVAALAAVVGATASGLAPAGNALPAEPEAPLPGHIDGTGASVSSLAAGRSQADRRSAPPAAPSGNYLLRNGVFTPLADVPDSLQTIHVALDDRGDTAGVYAAPAANPDGFVARGFLLRSGSLTTIEAPNASFTTPSGLNNRGQVVGFHLDADADPTPDPNGALPPGSVHGFIWQRGELRTLDVPGALNTQPFDINNRGEIVGAYIAADNTQHGFRWDHGRITTIDPPAVRATPGGPGTRATGINDRGHIVGSYFDGTTFHGFVRHRRAYSDIDPPGSQGLTEPSGINERDQIVGRYLADTTGQLRGFLRDRSRITVIPDAPGNRCDTVAAGINSRGHILIPAPGALKPNCPTPTATPSTTTAATSALSDR